VKIAGKGLDNKKGLDDKRLDTRGLDEKKFEARCGERTSAQAASTPQLSMINPQEMSVTRHDGPGW